MHKLKGVRLSKEADKDLDDIYEFSFAKFGMSIAERYLTALNNLFLQLVQFPNEGILRSELQPNLRSIPVRSHSVYYTIADDHVFIVRVLHQSRDVLNYF